MNNAAPAVLAFVGVGANIEQPRVRVEQGIAALRGLQQTQVSGCSSLYGSAALHAPGPDYVNAVVALHTTLSAAELLRALHAIETRFGRVRSTPNAPRTLDLDLLLYGRVYSDDAALRLPHPRLHQRAFVLRPLLEIAPQLQVDSLGPLSAWLDRVRDQPIHRLEAADTAR